MSGPQLILNAQPACTVTSQCQLAKATDMMRAAQTMLAGAERQMQELTPALWCDSGGHAFSARDPGRQVMTVRVLADDGVTEQEESRTICGACAEKAGLLRGRITNSLRRALPGHPDPVKIRELESELGMPPSGTGETEASPYV